MSVLTKVFVVLVAVLSIMLVALVVPFVANTEDFRASALASDAKAKGAVADAQLKQSVIESLQQNASQAVSDLNSRNSNLERELATLKDKLNDAETGRLTAEADKASFKADFGRLTAAEQQHAEINKSLEAELGQRRTDMSTLQTQVIQLADHIKEVESQLQASSREQRRDAEMLVQLQAENAKQQAIIQRMPPEMRDTNAGSTASSQQPIEPANPIQGKVTKVEKVEGDTFAQVNVGKNDGVQENMKFLVHRGDQYLGSLIITYVDTNAASGRMTLEKGAIAEGDQVLAGGR